MVEIASLTEHRLTECDKKDSFGKCQRCSEAIAKEDLQEHLKTKNCNGKPKNIITSNLIFFIKVKEITHNNLGLTKSL